MMDYTKEIEIYFDRLKSTIDLIDKEALNTLMNVMDCARKRGNHILSWEMADLRLRLPIMYVILIKGFL